MNKEIKEQTKEQTKEQAAIEIKEISKSYPGYGFVLRNFSLVIPNGQIVGIFGENGAGKSTLLRCIMGLTALNKGEVLIDGLPIQKSYHKVSFITEEGSSFSSLTAAAYGRFLQDFIPNFNKERYRLLLDFFEIRDRDKIKTLSKGQKTKLEVSAGFSKGAKYILMDEPFSGNDLFTRRDFMKLMAGSLKAEESIVICTHLIDEIEQFIDRALILRFGKILADVSMEDLANENSTLAEYMMKALDYDKERFLRMFLSR